MNQFFKKIIFFIFLLVVCFVLLLFHGLASDLSLTTLSENLPSTAIISKSIDSYRDKIIIEFVASNNFLSIVSLKFKAQTLPPDKIIFRIKERGQKKWYAINTYTGTDLFLTPQYLFGFSPIQNSKNKQYLIELSASREPTDEPQIKDQLPFSISDEKLAINAKYSFDKNELLKDKKLLISFLTRKLEYGLFFFTSYFEVVICFAPLLIYIFVELILKVLPNKKHFFDLENKFSFLNQPFILLLLLFIFFRIFFSRAENNIFFILFAFIWLISAFYFNLKSEQSFSVCLILLVLNLYSYLFHLQDASEKLTFWSSIFLVVGTFQAALELNPKAEDRIRGIILEIKPYVNKINQLLENSKLYNSINKWLDERYPKNSQGYVLVFIKLAVIYSFLCLIFFVKNLAIKYFDRLSTNPKIYEIEPALVYPGQKIILFGANFCDNDRIKCIVVASNKKPIYADLMSGGKIIFTVPFGWEKNTEIYLKIEKEINWMGKKEKAISNTVKFKLLDPLSPWDKNTDLYFNELEGLNKETLILNGYLR